MKNLQVTEKVQLSVGLKFTFMGVDLSSYYKKTADGYQIFLAPANVSNDVQLTLKEMIGQFNGMAGEGALSEDDVKSKIAEEEDPQVVNAIDFDSVKFCLKMLFLNIEKRRNGRKDSRIRTFTANQCRRFDSKGNQDIPDRQFKLQYLEYAASDCAGKNGIDNT